MKKGDRVFFLRKDSSGYYTPVKAKIASLRSTVSASGRVTWVVNAHGELTTISEDKLFLEKEDAEGMVALHVLAGF
jgi:hypothetical protein